MSKENMNTFAENLVARWKLDLIDELRNRPNYQFTIKELSEKTSGSYGSVRSFIHTMREWKVVNIVKKGGSILVNYETDNEYDKLISLLLKTESDYLKELAEEYVENLVDDFPKIEKVILYGSVARGDAGANSDIDLLIIGNLSEEKIRKHAHNNSGKATISPIVKNQQRFSENLEDGSEWEKQVKQDGVTLYS